MESSQISDWEACGNEWKLKCDNICVCERGRKVDNTKVEKLFQYGATEII